MREIKFRAWDKLLQRWLVRNVHLDVNSGKLVLLGIKPDVELATLEDCNVELVQFTGLHDKNGKEMYHKYLVRDEYKNIWLIDWSDEYAGFELSLIYSEIFDIPKLSICRVVDMEYIGNIYENPELIMKEGEK